jgi:hypothetical protein
MKSGELIKQLQELDPTGEIEVIGSNGDIYFAELDYSNAETLLIHDPALKGKAYSIIGIQIGQEAKPTRPGLIILHEMDMDDVFCDDPDMPVTVYHNSQWVVERIRNSRKNAKKAHAWAARWSARYNRPVIRWLEYRFNKYFRWPIKKLFKWLGD